MNRNLYAGTIRQRQAGSARSTTLLCLVLILLGAGVLFGLRFMPGGDLLAQDRDEAKANPPRPVHRESPVYPVALRATRWIWGTHIAHCEETATARAGNLRGYPILLQRVTFDEPGTYNTDNPRRSWTHFSLVLVPKNEEPPPPVRAIDWEEAVFLTPVHAAYLGQDESYHWYGRMPLVDLLTTKLNAKLTGGDDLRAPTERFVTRYPESLGYRGPLSLLARIEGERALPLLERLMAHRNPKIAEKAIRAMSEIRAERCTETLMNMYEKNASRPQVLYALGSNREAAKSVYMDVLANYRQTDGYGPRVGIDAAEQFQWREALPYLEQIKHDAAYCEYFDVASRAIRSIRGNPVPEEIDEANRYILADRMNRTRDREKLADARRLLLNHPDKDAVLLVAIRLIGSRTKASFPTWENLFGVELLSQLPLEVTLPTVALFLEDPRLHADYRKVYRWLEHHRDRDPVAFLDFVIQGPRFIPGQDPSERAAREASNYYSFSPTAPPV